MTVISSFFILEFHYKSYSLCTNPLNMNDNQTNRTPWQRWTTTIPILTMPTANWSMSIQDASSRTARDSTAAERKLRWDEENRLMASDDNGFVTNYWYMTRMASAR